MSYQQFFPPRGGGQGMQQDSANNTQVRIIWELPLRKETHHGWWIMEGSRINRIIDSGSQTSSRTGNVPRHCSLEARLMMENITRSWVIREDCMQWWVLVSGREGDVHVYPPLHNNGKGNVLVVSRSDLIIGDFSPSPRNGYVPLMSQRRIRDRQL